MSDWAEILRKHAAAIDAAIQDFERFVGTDAEEHTENLSAAAQQFREDADEYEQKATTQ